MSFFLPVILVVALVLSQGALLQVATALTGEVAPRYGRALSTALLAAFFSTLASAAYGCTVGIFVSAISSTVAAALAALVTLWVTSMVYRRRLSVSTGQALLIALIHEVMAVVLSGAAWWVVRSFA
jgi:hypothetical protein